MSTSRNLGWGEYRYRDASLLKMGYPDYSTYLKSPLWRKIRKRVLTRWCICQVRDCTSRATQCHHEQYTWENLKGQSLNYLMAVCAPCHQWLEFTAEGEKRNPAEVARLSERWRFCKSCGLTRPSDRWNKKKDICRGCSGKKFLGSREVHQGEKQCKRCKKWLGLAGFDQPRNTSCTKCLNKKRRRRARKREWDQKQKQSHTKFCVTCRVVKPKMDFDKGGIECVACRIGVTPSPPVDA